MPPTPPFSRFARRLSLSAAAVLATCVFAAPASAAPAAPALAAPVDGASVSALPPFKWNPVSGADHYEFELSANSGFTSVVYSVTTTKNTRASVKTVQPNGTYYWRVRGVTAAGNLGAWSPTRSFTLAWTAQPSLLSPAHGAAITYPDDALTLKWEAVPGAAKYAVRLATDLALGSLVWTQPFETPATNYALNTPLAPGTYYWNITPLDAEGHAGTPSPTVSFQWVWPTAMAAPLSVTDLVAAEEVFDPQLAWPTVPGAAGYEVEINFAPEPDWPTGSRVCCAALSFSTKATTLGTSYAPELVLDNTKTFRWRVRAIDASGNAGEWNEGPSFTKPFDNVPPVTAPSVKDVRMRDNLGDPATDSDLATPELDTAAPVAVWNSVPGASGYQVNISIYNGVGCDWATGYVKETATPAWTPLGWSKVLGDGPWPTGGTPSTDQQALVAGNAYCVRVRAVDRPSGITGPTVLGDWTYLNGNNQIAFRWDGQPASAACTAPCQTTASDYVTPLTGTTEVRMPVFTWRPLAGSESYYVVVAQDANFTNVVDYAFTRIPAYAPRKGTQSRGYPDDANLHWAVLPADEPNGSGVYGDILSSGAQTFAKQSAPPTLVGPVADAAVNTAATVFRWNPVAEGVRRYRIQVSQDQTFASTLEDVLTDATAYTSSETYPSDRSLYWRVRAEAEDGSSTIALPWSATGTFTKQLPRPTWDGGNPTAGAAIPALSWSPVPGAISYRVRVEEPDGDVREYGPFPTHAVSWKQFTGVGITKAWVRANFPKRAMTATSVEAGPWSTDFWSYAHTMPAPSNLGAEAGPSKLLASWDARFGAESYRVQISTRADFGTFVENTTTQTTDHAPLLTHSSYTYGGNLYWRVAFVDADNNTGDFSPAQTFSLPKLLRLNAFGSPRKGRYADVTILATDGPRNAVRYAKVCLGGAGISTRCKRTGTLGRATFRVKATRYGKVSVKATKSGYKTAYLKLNVT